MALTRTRLSTNSSVIKSFAIIEFLAQARSAKELGIISKELGMDKSTVYRFLTTLSQLGYVFSEPVTGRYSLGPKFVSLASQFLENLDIRNLSQPHLQQLAEETGETVHLAVLDNFEVVYIDKIEGRQPVEMRSTVGNRMPAHSTGLGKALLASMDSQDWHAYVDAIGLRAYTRNTITKPDSFYQEMQKILHCGYAIDNCENEEGMRCLAAPIRKPSGKTVAALSVSGWSVSMTSERDELLAPLLLETAKSISAKLGI